MTSKEFDYPTMTVRFEMSLWQRIRAASMLWWDVVVNGALECEDDRMEAEKLDDEDTASQTR